MAKYDQNYDIRDRARFLRQLVLPDEATALSKYAKKILLAAKPAPVLESAYKGERLGGGSGSVSTGEAEGHVPHLKLVHPLEFINDLLLSNMKDGQSILTKRYCLLSPFVPFEFSNTKFAPSRLKSCNTMPHTCKTLGCGEWGM